MTQMGIDPGGASAVDRLVGLPSSPAVMGPPVADAPAGIPPTDGLTPLARKGRSRSLIVDLGGEGPSPPASSVPPGHVSRALQARVTTLAAQQKPDGLWRAPYVAAPMHTALASIASNVIGDKASGAADQDKRLLLTALEAQSPTGAFPAYPGGPPSRANTRVMILALRIALETNPALAQDPQARRLLQQAETRAKLFVISGAKSEERSFNSMLADAVWNVVRAEDPVGAGLRTRAERSQDLLLTTAMKHLLSSPVQANALLHTPGLSLALDEISQPMQMAVRASAVLNDGLGPQDGLQRTIDRVSRVVTGDGHAESLAALKQEILANQDGNGGWLYMGMMTVMNLLALRKLGVPGDDPVMQKGLQFLREQQAADGKGGVRQSFSNGEIWDTALAGATLLRNGVKADDPRIVKAIEALLPEQHNGRWSFATNSQHGMENDTTNVTTMFLALAYPSVPPSLQPRLREALRAATDALLKNQQDDHGWNAWLPTHRGFGNRVPGTMEAVAVDASTADVTGRVMLALSAVAKSGAVDRTTQRRIETAKADAVTYLREAKTEQGWWSRWMIGYATTGGWAIPALRLSGVKPDDPMIVSQRAFLLAHQNPNGGFGESPAADSDPGQAAKGRSTPAQTALALMALIASSPADDIRQDPQIARAVHYLLHPEPGDDKVAVYTANPGLEYYQSEWQLVPTALRLYEDAVRVGVTRALAAYTGS